MKRERVPWLLVAGLVLVALTLGVANKIWSDRRARRIADSLNRTQADVSATVPHDSKTTSTQEPRRPIEERSKDASGKGDLNRIDLTKLRKAVMAGDAAGVESTLGTPAAEDASAIHSVLYQIPPGLEADEAKVIKSFLVNLLQKTPGEEAAGLLLSVVMQDGFLPTEDWISSVIRLGFKKFRTAGPYFESMAFPAAESSSSYPDQIRSYAAMRALVAMDSAHYVPLISDRVRTQSPETLWPYVSALAFDAESGIDISAAVSNLQSRFVSLPPTRGGDRIWIAKALEQHALKSESTRTWLLRELKLRLDAGVAEELERNAYIAALKRLNP